MTAAVVLAALVPATSAQAATAPPTPTSPSPTPTAVPASTPGTARYIVVLKDTVADPAATATAQARTARASLRGVYRSAVKAYVADVPPAAVATIERDPATQFVTQDHVVRRHERPAKPLPTPPRCNTIPAPGEAFDLRPCWIPRVGADHSSTRSGDGRGTVNVNVGVIDDGLDASNPELNVAGGTDCRSGVAQGPQTLQGEHGTEVGGVIGARDDGIGTVGIAPGTPLYGVTVFDATGEGPLSNVICAVDWTTSTRQDRDPSNDLQVVNMSLDDPETADTAFCGIPAKDAFHVAICRGTATGITYVAAAGNETAPLSTPGGYSEVLTASGMEDFDGAPGGRNADANCYGFSYREAFGDVDHDDEAAFFSDYAASPKDRLHMLAAPAACIMTTQPSTPGLRNYAAVDGTSFASPIAAGTAALCITSGKCQPSRPLATITRLVADANAYTLTHPAYGFAGDPLRPRPGRYYGPLINAGLY